MLVALISAGVVLAVGFVILEIRAHWEEYAAQHGDPDFWTALQIVGVSLLSLTSIPQILEARRGARLVSDAPLTETERWVLGLGGLVQVVVFLLGVRAGLWSLGRRGAPRPVDVDGPGGGAPRPAARGPAGGGPGNGGAARPATSGSTGGGAGNGGAPCPVDADRPGVGQGQWSHAVRNDAYQFSRHMINGKQVVRDLARGREAHVFNEDVDPLALERRVWSEGTYNGEIRGWHRFTYHSPTPIGRRIQNGKPDVPLYVVEIKVRQRLDGVWEYHLISFRYEHSA